MRLESAPRASPKMYNALKVEFKALEMRPQLRPVFLQKLTPLAVEQNLTLQWITRFR